MRPDVDSFASQNKLLNSTWGGNCRLPLTYHRLKILTMLEIITIFVAISAMLPIPEHLYASLKEVQQHYLCLKEDYTEKLKLTETQISHVEALVNGDLAPPPSLLIHLQQLEEYYRQFESEFATKELESITLLSHVEALIVGAGMLQPEPEAQIEVKQVVEPEEASTTTDTYSVESFLMSLHSATRMPLSLCLQKGGEITIADINGCKTLSIVAPTKDLEQRILSRIKSYQQRFSSWVGGKGKVFLAIKSPTATPQSKGSTESSDLLPQYQGMAPIAAIEQLLRENQGSILHLDFIVRSVAARRASLYGELNQNDIARLTVVVKEALKLGVKQGLWDVDPDNPTCYTLNYLELVG